MKVHGIHTSKIANISLPLELDQSGFKLNNLIKQNIGPLTTGWLPHPIQEGLRLNLFCKNVKYLTKKKDLKALVQILMILQFFYLIFNFFTFEFTLSNI